MVVSNASEHSYLKICPEKWKKTCSSLIYAAL